MDDPVYANAKFITHNSSGYDTHFILNYIVHQGRAYPEMTTTDGKILKLPHTQISFIDSFVFLSVPLNKFSDTFNLLNIIKSTFPHLFNTPDNNDYNGPIPTIQRLYSD